MDKNIFKNLLITIGVGIIVIACILLFFKLLPFILIGLAILWIAIIIIRKVRKIGASNKEETYENHTSNEEYYSDSEDFDISDAIDVDYKEIDKK